MTMNRRRLFAAFAGLSAGAATPALARETLRNDSWQRESWQREPWQREAMPRAEIDAVSLGVRPNDEADQSMIVQRAIARAAAAGAVLRLPAGNYRAGGLQLPPYAAIAGVAGATRIVMAGGPSMLASTGSDHVSLTGLVLDGGNLPLPDGRGLVHLTQGRNLRIADCEITGAGGDGIKLQSIAGEVTGNTVDAADFAIFSNDAAGLRISGNTVRGAGNGGILVWRGTPGDDGTLVIDNRIEDITNKSGRLRTIRQRHQHFPRRQRHRARQPHPQRGILGGARQQRLQSADRRQYLHRARRDRALRRIRFRGRGDRQQHRRRRGDRRDR